MPVAQRLNELDESARQALAAELQAYNSAFVELELPWQWDAETFERLRELAPDSDCIGAYVERNQSHLLRVYEKSFLRDLVLTAKARHHASTTA